MQVFDIKEGKSTKTVPSKKYGVHLARFTHHSRQVLHASTKVDGESQLSAPTFGVNGLTVQRLFTTAGPPQRELYPILHWPFGQGYLLGSLTRQ